MNNVEAELAVISDESLMALGEWTELHNLPVEAQIELAKLVLTIYNEGVSAGVSEEQL